MNVGLFPSSFARVLVIFSSALATGGPSTALGAGEPAELFAIHLRFGDGSSEYRYGPMDPATLQLRPSKGFIILGATTGILSDLSAVEPSGRRFYLAGTRSLIVVEDGETAVGIERPLQGLSGAEVLRSIEHDPLTGDVFALVMVSEATGYVRLVRIDPTSGHAAPLGTSAVPGIPQGNSAVDWRGRRFFVPGFEEGEIRLSTLDLGTGEVLASTRVGIVQEGLRTIEWDPFKQRLLAVTSRDFVKSTLIQIDPWTGELRSSGVDLPVRVAAPGATLDPAARRLYFLADGKVWAVDADTGRQVASSFEAPNRIFSLALLPAGKAFRRGDGNADGKQDIADPIELLDWLFRGGPPRLCPDSADSDDDGSLSLGDAIHSLSFIFLGGPPPASPHPRCGPDPTPDRLRCLAYPRCP